MIAWILSIIAVEAVTEIIVQSNIFSRLRNALAKVSNFLGEWITCGYCLSIWISASVAWFLPGDVTHIVIIDYLIRIFVLHRISNVLHELLSRWFSRLPIVLMIGKPVNIDDQIGDDDGEE